MRKLLIGTVVGILLVFIFGAASLTTRISSYRTLHSTTDINSADTDPNAILGYTPGAVSGEVDLLVKAGAGADTYANALSLIVKAGTAADGDTVTQALYGRSDQGPRQRIASIVWTIGTAQFDTTSTNLWADDAAITSTHIKTITEADGGGSDRVCSITFEHTN